MARFSVIIPTYNRAALLREALDTVFAQTFTDYEVIVVDDGSTDGTWEDLQALGSRVRALRQQNAGPGAARNLGAQHATGDYLAFLDSDELWFPWTLATYWRAIQEFGGPSIVTGYSITLGIEPAISDAPANIDLRGYDCFFDAWEAGHGFEGTPGMAVSASAFRSAGGFLTAAVNGEDQDLCLRLGSSPSAVHVLAPPVFLHRVHGGNVTRDVEKSIAGANLLLERERKGMYPGDVVWQRVRRKIICAIVRDVSILSVEDGQFQSAARLYRESLFWQIGLGQFKYVIVFPLSCLRNYLRRPHATF